MDIDRLRVSLTTARGGDGVMTFYAVPGGGHQADVKTFISSLANNFANGTSFQVPNTGDTLESTTGTLTGTWTFGTVGNFTSAAASSYAGGVGARIKWSTGSIFHGRHVKGSTFLVPLNAAAYDTDGTIVSSSLTALQTIVDTFRTAMGSSQLIWSRPTPTQTGGAFAVTGGIVVDKVSWLRSRRT